MFSVMLLTTLAVPAPDAEKLLGTWTVVALQDDGFDDVGGKGGGGYTLTVTADTMRVTSPQGKVRWLDARYTLDPAKGWIDFERLRVGPKGTLQGLYELTDDTLRIVWYSKGPGKRPARFESSAQDPKNGNDKYIIARRETGFVPLAGGKWKDDARGWTVDRGLLTPGDAGTSLATARTDYTDFVLRLEWSGEVGSTGRVALRGPDDKAWQLQLGATEASGGRTKITPHVVFGGKKYEAVFPSNHPQYYLEARVAGDRLTVWLTGNVVVDNVPVKGGPAAGPIAFGAGGKASFRNPRVRVGEEMP